MMGNKKYDYRRLLETTKNELSDLTNMDNPDFRLEQAEFNTKECIWEVVVSFLIKKEDNPIKNLTTNAFFNNFYRVYKKVVLNEDYSIAGFYVHENR